MDTYRRRETLFPLEDSTVVSEALAETSSVSIIEFQISFPVENTTSDWSIHPSDGMQCALKSPQEHTNSLSGLRQHAGSAFDWDFEREGGLQIRRSSFDEWQAM
ncbi:uncharacterized protein RSE6_03578 [Rhynchosporium secalis]|uniref:Uncharacterized protein n=1 Tax=Rhynchosporium secalis TaxID=38038 RepID=A0A1E1M4L2_RHYSE|nr:uncharacterized protein RSE6_03578 [Rhynchosporium secalis]